jgi:hypothetical protein
MNNFIHVQTFHRPAFINVQNDVRLHRRARVSVDPHEGRNRSYLRAGSEIRTAVLNIQCMLPSEI